MAEGKKTYELKDKNTSFFDDETRLEITRDQRVEIGPGAGKKTTQMIAKGGLIEVTGEPQPPTGAGKADSENEDALPADLPGKLKLEAAGHKTRASIRALTDDQLQSVVGKATAEKIREALKA